MEQIKVSKTAENTFNPIRNLVDRGTVEPDPQKESIPLSLGDPTVFGNLRTHDAVRQAMIDVIKEGKSDGYNSVIGSESARQAITNRYRHRFDDIVITSGCSGALDLAISVLCGPNDFILLPKPGFTLYSTLATSKSINVLNYPLDEGKNWEIKLERVEAMVKEHQGKIKAWLINNPSNPCGSVYSEEHLKACLKLARKYNIVIIADEIYEDMVFSGSKYVPMAKLSQDAENENEMVPILTCSGLAKRFLVPGWRFGWVAINEPKYTGAPKMANIKKGLFDLASLIIGACTLIQGALPNIFENTPETFYSNVNKELEMNSNYVFEALEKIPGLKVIKPQGTIYMLVKVDLHGIKNDVEFYEQLLREQSVSVLPGSIFGMAGFVRIIFSAPMDKLKVACARIKEFVESVGKRPNINA